DGVNNTADNCPQVANPNQANNDGDSQGDACDADDDNDTVSDSADNCPLVANTSQANNDGDTQGDPCDADDDNDGVADPNDNCELTANSDQANRDGDSLGDACDSDADGDGSTVPADCNDQDATVNPDATEVNDGKDNNCNGVVDEGFEDTDGDGVRDLDDNCPSTANPSQTDSDGDGIGDACDSTPFPTPTAKDQCSDGNWQNLTDENGNSFASEKACRDYAKKGKVKVKNK
ncbi:MAG TPA: putative metal-binding motif-containing protein, partial [Candidatus Paceibacterota bacterium]|nr:putative metal-binding motif-containing protein [Candidatus Paceibacterota bacterium]